MSAAAVREIARAILFVDGSNWYHSLRARGVARPVRLSYSKISHKLVGGRTWGGTRYYIGALKQSWSAAAYADQRRLELFGNLPRG